MQFVFAKDATSQSIVVRAYDSTTFLPKTGLVFNTSGLTAYYRRGATGTATAITLVTQTVGGAYSSGGFVETDATNMPGNYRLDLPNAVIATGVDYVTLHCKSTGVVFEPVSLALTADNPYAASPTAAGIADAVLDELTSEHTTAGSLGKRLQDVDTNAGSAATKTTGLNFTVAGQVDANIHTVKGIALTDTAPVEAA